MSTPDRDCQASEPPWHVVGVLAVMTVALFLILSPAIGLSEWRVSSSNHNVMEALAWRQGRLDIPADAPDPLKRRLNDSACVDGRVYNVFPPLMTFFSYAALTLQSWQGMDEDLAREAGEPGTSTLYPPWYVLFAFWPLPIVGFWAMRESILAARETSAVPEAGPSPLTPSFCAAIVTAFWMLGTPLASLLYYCHNAGTNELNGVLAGTGLMLAAGDLVRRRRLWPAAIGLIWAMWSRQLAALYLVAIVWLVVVAWRHSRRANAGPSPVVRRGILAAAAVVVIGSGALATLNWLKFGNPLDSGYAAIYAGREKDIYARRYMRYQNLFDVRFVPENFYWMNLAPPTFEVRRMTIIINGEGDGTSIWITSPLLLAAFVAARRWWADPARRGLMLASLAVIAAFLCYHNTGSLQRGYHRFSMDFVPVWLVVIAPYVVTRRGLAFTLPCLVYSALYFHFLCH